MSRFRSEDEFKQTIEQIFTMMNDHDEVGPRLNRARAPHRFVFTDLDLVFNVTYTDDGEAAGGKYLRWTWDEEACDWEPVITLQMAADVANKYFQGRENIPMAVATGRIKLRGPLSRILELAPITRPVFAAYRDWLEDEGHDHLLL
jgi:hypothetical protein